MKNLVTTIVQELVDIPEKVKVTETRMASIIIFEVDVAVKDRGKVIGKSGNTIEALRTLAHCIGKKHGHKVTVNLIDDVKYQEAK